MKFRGSFVLLISIIYLVRAPTLLAFDTGYHTDLTRAVLRREGYSANVTDAVVLQNWITDLYGNWPMWTTQALPRSQAEQMEKLKRDLEKLHFDNLYTEAEVRAYWEQLVLNTKDILFCLKSLKCNNLVDGVTAVTLKFSEELGAQRAAVLLRFPQ